MQNLALHRQAMNHSYDRLALVNTYGAFGSICMVRHELVIEGIRDADLTSACAGLREGEPLGSVESSFLLSNHEAAVTGTRRGRRVAVRYLSVGPARDGFAWVRVRDVLDERCR